MNEARHQNKQLELLLESIPDGILAIDRKWKIIFANKAVEKLLKKKAGSLRNKNTWKEFPELVGNPFYKAYHKAMKSRVQVTVEEHYALLQKWIKATVYPSTNGIIVYFQNITNERKAQVKAKKSEENYRTFLDRITDGFIVLDKNFRYVYVNKKIGELVHRDPASLIGKNVWQEFPEAVNSLTYKAFQTAMKEQRFISNIDYYETLNLWQENYIYPSPAGLSIFIKDISDRKKLEKELRQQQRDQQFEVMVTAIEAQEKERTEIGRELHDNVNQLLVATKLMLAIMKEDEQKISKDMLGRSISNLEKAIEENRRISHELVAPDLKEGTLVEQLHFLMQTMLASNGIKVTMNIAGFNELLFDETKKLAVYRIAQEQCTNILKYAKAGSVAVRLRSAKDSFTFTIADDGVGMDDTIKTKGIGLKNIAARVQFLGGELRIISKSGKGFELRINIPNGATLPSHSLFETV
jgi:PAS domain S-box-containing protein